MSAFIDVTVSTPGEDIWEPVRVRPGTTVEAAVEKAGIEIGESSTFTLNSLAVNGDDEIHDSDDEVIIIVGEKTANG